MAFRRNESEEEGFERALRVLTPKGLSPTQQHEIRHFLEGLVVKLGPVVRRYPSWHPLVCNHESKSPITTPSERCGYKGLDHTVLFANGFVSCPYGDGQQIIESVHGFYKVETSSRYDHVAQIEVKKLDRILYNESTTPVLVECKWHEPLNSDKTIPKGIAVGLMLEAEVRNWRWSKVGETWETMRTYLLGEPCGKRSSMFLDQEGGQTMKKVFEAIMYSGMYGPLKV